MYIKMLPYTTMVVLFGTLLHNPSGISVVIDIPENINELCPYTDICNVPAKAHLNATGKKPCCHQCSCDKLCGLRLDCCFKDNDTFRLVEKGHVDCIKPIEGNAGLIDMHYTYYMIKYCNIAGNSVGEPCKTHDVYGNSLIAPVSSTNSGYIYVNSECAQCNGKENFIEWKAVLFYNYRKYATFIRLDFAESLSNGISVLVYKPPVTVAWHNSQCFKETDFSDMKCNANEYLDTCENLYAPYTTVRGSVYRNVYCQKCENNNYSSIDLECEDKLNGRSPMTNFGMLMDMKEVNAIRQNNKIEYFPSTTGRECNDDNETPLQKDCLKLFCPEGQIETQKGCTYLGQWWYGMFFSMQVKLLPAGSNQLPFSTLLSLNTTERNKPFSWIQPPCRDANLNRITVYYKRSDNDTEKEIVESLVVVVGRSTVSSNGFDPSIVIPLMQLCANKPWTLTINNKRYTFKATFDDYMMYVQDGIHKHTKLSIVSGNFIEEKQPQPAMYDVLMSTDTQLSYQAYKKLERLGIWLRKSYFCKQVRIPIDDIETDYGKITILSKNITIGDNKYTLNYYQDSNDHLDYKRLTFSVCLDDYLSPESSNCWCIMRMVSGYKCIIFLHFLLIAILHVLAPY